MTDLKDLIHVGYNVASYARLVIVMCCVCAASFVRCRWEISMLIKSDAPPQLASYWPVTAHGNPVSVAMVTLLRDAASKWKIEAGGVTASHRRISSCQRDASEEALILIIWRTSQSALLRWRLVLGQ